MNELKQVDILDTMVLCAAVKAELLQLTNPQSPADKLFDFVDYFPEKNLEEALQALIIVDQRLCLIIPAGDFFSLDTGGRTLETNITTSFDLLIADRAYLKQGQAAAFGGDNNLGVVAIKDLVVRAFAANPQLATADGDGKKIGLRWCGLYPTAGAPIALPDKRKTPGRQAWVLTYQTASGRLITPITAPWGA